MKEEREQNYKIKCKLGLITMKWSIAQATVLSYYSRRRFVLCARILVCFERESFFTLTRVGVSSRI